MQVELSLTGTNRNLLDASANEPDASLTDVIDTASLHFVLPDYPQYCIKNETQLTQPHLAKYRISFGDRDFYHLTIGLHTGTVEIETTSDREYQIALAFSRKNLNSRNPI